MNCPHKDRENVMDEGHGHSCHECVYEHSQKNRSVFPSFAKCQPSDGWLYGVGFPPSHYMMDEK